MSEEDQSSKTLDPSERKLQKAREQGETWSSREGGHFMTYLALLVITLLVLPLTLPNALGALGAIFSSVGQVAVIEHPEELNAVVGRIWRGAGMVLIPAMAVMLLFACIAIGIGGPLFASLKRLEPKLSKLNPLAGIKRMFGPQALVEFTKSLLKLLILGSLFLWAAYQTIMQLLPGSLLLPEQIFSFTASGVLKGLIYVCAAMLPFVMFDIFWKRFQFMKKQRMSMKEMKDEHRDSEGDPQIRAKRQQLRMQRARRPLSQTVPTATVVVMNPTHYAVALRYERGIDIAPICVAKGMDSLALKIRDMALEHDVAVIESPPLARALHAVAEEDQPIPEAHWAAVAELVGYVLDLRKRIKRKLPPGARQIN